MFVVTVIGCIYLGFKFDGMTIDHVTSNTPTVDDKDLTVLWSSPRSSSSASMTSAANPIEMAADLENSRGHGGYTRRSHSSKRRSQRVLERASRVVVPQHT